MAAGVNKHAPRVVAAALLLAPSMAAADVGPGVPAEVVEMPGAAAPARAALDEPSGAPAYTVELPRGTPRDVIESSRPRPLTTFVDALRQAYWTNPALLAERARLRSTDFRLPQARAAYGPRLGFEGTYGYLRDNFELPTGGSLTRSGWSSTASAILTQPVFTFGRNAAGERQATAQIAFQRDSLRSAEIATFFNAISAYAAVLRDRSGLEIVRDDLALLERELADNQARFQKREVTSTDVQQVETRVEQSRAQVLLAERTAANSEAAFLATVGAPAGDLGAPNPLSMPVAAIEEAYAYADSHSPIIGAAYARERISRAARDAARSDLLPRVDLRGRADYGTVSPYSDNLRQTTLRGEVVISGPIFESGLLRARMDEAQAANDADWRLIDAALRENRAEVADAWNEWRAQTASIDRLRLASEAAHAAFEGALLQEKAGLRTTLDVLNLARELLVARSSYNTTIANAYLAQARLLAALGALNLSQLFPEDSPYDPDAHFDRVKDNGDVPLLTPLLRSVDGLLVGGRTDRPVRDPAAGVAVQGARIPLPGPSQGGAYEKP